MFAMLARLWHPCAAGAFALLIIFLFEGTVGIDDVVSVPPIPVGDFRGYMTVAQVDAWISAVADAFPQFTKSGSIGKSVEGRHLTSLCIGYSCTEEGKAAFPFPSEYVIPQSFFNGQHHSREPISTMTVIYFIHDVLDGFVKGSETRVHLLKTREMWFVPIINPDGYELNRKLSPNGCGMQRKNVAKSSTFCAKDFQAWT